MRTGLADQEFELLNEKDRKVSGKDEEEDEVRNREVSQEKWEGKISRLFAGMRIQGPELRTSEMTLLPNRTAWHTYISGTRQGSLMRLCWESDPNVEGPLSKNHLVSDQNFGTSSWSMPPAVAQTRHHGEAAGREKLRRVAISRSSQPGSGVALTAMAPCQPSISLLPGIGLCYHGTGW